MRTHRSRCNTFDTSNPGDLTRVVWTTPELEVDDIHDHEFEWQDVGSKPQDIDYALLMTRLRGLFPSEQTIRVFLDRLFNFHKLYINRKTLEVISQ
jgi:hypothetical protein